jgi:hypothetical protein
VISCEPSIHLTVQHFLLITSVLFTTLFWFTPLDSFFVLFAPCERRVCLARCTRILLIIAGLCEVLCIADLTHGKI